MRAFFVFLSFFHKIRISLQKVMQIIKINHGQTETVGRQFQEIDIVSCDRAYCQDIFCRQAVKFH